LSVVLGSFLPFFCLATFLAPSPPFKRGFHWCLQLRIYPPPIETTLLALRRIFQTHVPISFPVSDDALGPFSCLDAAPYFCSLCFPFCPALLVRNLSQVAICPICFPPLFSPRISAPLSLMEGLRVLSSFPSFHCTPLSRFSPNALTLFLTFLLVLRFFFRPFF